MEASSSRSRQSVDSHLNHKRFLLTHIAPAIRSQSCPICLSQIEEPAVITVCLHAYCTDCIRKWSYRKRKCPLCNTQFASLFVRIDLNSMTFLTQHLSAIKESGTKINGDFRDFYSSRRDFMAQRRAIRISRERNIGNRRTRPLPKQRSFEQSNMLPPGVSKERILQWRASIYKRNLLAVPCPTRKSLEQGLMGIKRHNKKMLLKRIEPWIHREVQAILEDPNPAILVHLVTSLFITSLEETKENDYLERLNPFLLKWTSTFWHELRCFAESSLNMETYDTVVKYSKNSN
ncbi:hypothetical protein R6Q59_022230 [Mikania micrantha]